MKSIWSLLSVVIIMLMANCTSTKNMSANQKIRIADQLYEQGSYYNAIDLYNEVLKEDAKNEHAAYNIAELYFISRDYKNAEKAYSNVLKLSKDKYPLAQYQYAQCLKMNGKYAEAKIQFTAGSQKLKETNEQNSKAKKMAKNEIAACDFAMKAVKEPLPIRVDHLGNNINAAYSEFAPIPAPNNMLLFSSLRSDSVIDADHRIKGKYLTKIYQAKRDDINLSASTLMPPAINDETSHNGNGTFSLNGKRFYFTRCTEDPEEPENKTKLLCSIYMSEFANGNWQDPVMLGKEINAPDCVNTHPAIGSDGSGKEVLYFTSDRKDGQGGMDIWYSVITKDGFKVPVNLGKKLNTIGDEVTPFYDKKFNTLYYSSNGLPGLGGYDIFKSEGSLKKMSPPENIGSPLNSSVDDMYFVTESTGKGYLTSNRIGSIALKSETCCDDIYKFEYVTILNLAVEGFVLDAEDTTIIIDSAKVTLYSRDKESGENVVVAEQFTQNKKMYFFDLLQNKEYLLSASKNGYFSGKGLYLDYKNVSTMGLLKSDTLRADMYLLKMKKNVGYVIQNIYYDFDKATLRPESKQSLDSIMLILNLYPAIKIEIGSHTDSKGSDEYNIKLSQKRAESVIQYLIKSGMPSNRLAAKGYGETTPIATNENPDGSDNPEGRQLNRRTEFKIIGEVPITVQEADVPEEMKISKKKNKQEQAEK